MKKWIARKLFRMAVRIDIAQATEEARILVFVADLMAEAKAPAPKKVGRPLGRKDSVGKLLAPKKKVGRPLGRKDSAPRKRKVTPA
jgi:hypothetical protein